MAFSIIYRRLFELQFLPGFALDAADGTAFADRSTTDQNTALARFDMKDWINIVPTAATQSVLAGLKMKVHRTGTSFFAGIEVNAEGADYRPVVAPVEGTRFRFLLKTGNPLLANIGNLPWRPPFPAKLFFIKQKQRNLPISG
ncbi:MAG: hypothetical protein R3B47_08795 [Bacteroidia bacterium]